MKFLPFSTHERQHMLLIVDYKYYSEQTDIIDDWCKDSFGYDARQGMLLSFANEIDMTTFLLRWN